MLLLEVISGYMLGEIVCRNRSLSLIIDLLFLLAFLFSWKHLKESGRIKFFLDIIFVPTSLSYQDVLPHFISGLKTDVT
jgi:hypothetical protein